MHSELRLSQTYQGIDPHAAIHPTRNEPDTQIVHLRPPHQLDSVGDSLSWIKCFCGWSFGRVPYTLLRLEMASSVCLCVARVYFDRFQNPCTNPTHLLGSFCCTCQFKKKNTKSPGYRRRIVTITTTISNNTNATNTTRWSECIISILLWLLSLIRYYYILWRNPSFVCLFDSLFVSLFFCSFVFALHHIAST